MKTSPDQELGNLVRRMAQFVPGSVLPGVLSLLTVSVFTRLFGATEFGQYSLVLSVCKMTVAVSTQWIKVSITRFLPEAADEDAAGEIKRSIAQMMWVNAAGLLLIGLLAVPFVRSQDGVWGSYVAAVVAFVLTVPVYEVLGTVLQAEAKAASYSTYAVLFAVGRVVVPLGIILLAWDHPAAVFWGTALTAVLILPPLWRRAGMAPFGSGRLFDRIALMRGYRTYGRYGFPLIGWFLGSTLLQFSDRFVIQAFRGSYEVGLYSAPQSLTLGLVNVVLAPISLAILPFMFRTSSRHGADVTARWLENIVRWIVILSAMGVGVAYVLRHELNLLLFGADFAPVAALFPVILIGALMWFLGAFFHLPLTLAKETPRLMFASFAAVFVNAGLNLIFVPGFGVPAAAWSTVAACVCYYVVVRYMGRKHLAWRIPWRHWLLAFAAIALAALAGDWTKTYVGHRWGTAMGLVAGGLVYVMMLTVPAAMLVRTLPDEVAVRLRDGARRALRALGSSKSGD